MNSRIEKKRKRRTVLKLLFIMSFIILLIAGYFMYQYNQGVKLFSEEKGMVEKDIVEKDYAFNGEKDENGRINVLLLGVDSRGETQSRSDTIIVAQFDPETDSTKLVSFMRDIYVEIPGYQNYKINTAFYLGGPDLVRQTLKENFDINIQYYMIVDFRGFENIIDVLAPKGIEIDVEKHMSERIGVVLEPGLQRLNGKELLGYARFRADPQSDFGRVERQHKALSAIKEELMSITSIPKIPKLLGATEPYMETNMSNWNQISLMKDIILSQKKEIERLTIPIKDSYWDNKYNHAGAVLELDFEKNQNAINDFLK